MRRADGLFTLDAYPIAVADPHHAAAAAAAAAVSLVWGAAVVFSGQFAAQRTHVKPERAVLTR